MSTLEDPALGLADGGAADALAAALLPDFEDAVEVVEQDAQAFSLG